MTNVAGVCTFLVFLEGGAGTGRKMRSTTARPFREKSRPVLSLGAGLVVDTRWLKKDTIVLEENTQRTIGKERAEY